MFCPKCIGKTKVVGTVLGQTNERWRRCIQCGYTFGTIEAIRFDDYWREYARSSCENDRMISKALSENNKK